MARKKQTAPTPVSLRDEMRREFRLVQEEARYIKKHLDKIWEYVAESSERIQDLEIQVNLLSRLFSTLAIEKVGMRLSDLRKLVRRIEKEAIDEYQIRHLEDLYKLEHPRSQDRKSKGS